MKQIVTKILIYVLFMLVLSDTIFNYGLLPYDLLFVVAWLEAIILGNIISDKIVDWIFGKKGEA